MNRPDPRNVTTGTPFPKPKVVSQECHVAGGRVVRCTHCGCISFTSQRILLTELFTVLNVPVPTRDAQVLICTGCGRFEWFAQAVEKSTLRVPNPQAAPE